jgi:hypothetical protein
MNGEEKGRKNDVKKRGIETERGRHRESQTESTKWSQEEEE